MASTIAAITTGIGGIVTTADATGNLSLLSGTSTVVAVTSAGAAVTGTMSVSGATTLTGGLNTPLAVTSGGTGVATSTGSGANVLGTSPTLTTPVINGFTGDTSVINIGSGQVYKDASGNVGIGTASTIAGTRLIVKDGYTAFQFNSGNTYPTYNSYYGAIGTNFDSGSSYLDFWNTVGSGFQWHIQTGASTQTPVMTINSSGNVGIGTASPGAKLDITNNQAALSYLIDTNNTTNGGGSIWRMITRNIANTGTTSVEFYKPTGTGFSILNNDTNASNFTAFNVGSSERMRIDSSGNLLFNSGYGSVATAYGCRAWVNFNGTGTVAIRASGNVSSITDNGVGLYKINFTTAMPDVNYSWTSSVGYGTTLSGDALSVTFYGDFATYQLVGGFSVITTDPSNGGTYDAVLINISVFR